MEFSIHTSKTHTWNPWSHQYLFLDSRYLHLLLMYMLNSFGIVAIGFGGLTVLGIIYTIFFLGKWFFQRYIGIEWAGGHSLRVFLLISSQWF
jgi:hypothetical protein